MDRVSRQVPDGPKREYPTRPKGSIPTPKPVRRTPAPKEAAPTPKPAESKPSPKGAVLIPTPGGSKPGPKRHPPRARDRQEPYPSSTAYPSTYRPEPGGKPLTYSDLHGPRRPQKPARHGQKPDPHPKEQGAGYYAKTKLQNQVDAVWYETKDNHSYHHQQTLTQAREKVRNVKRLMEHSVGQMPADIRVEKERELAACQADLDALVKERDQKAIVGQYHFVRFLERKRATKNFERLLKAAKEAKETLPADQCKIKLAELAPQLQDARVDINYTVYHPLREKYVSLFPKNDDLSNTDINGKKFTVIRNATGEKPPGWFVVQECMKSGLNALAKLRDGTIEETTLPLRGRDGEVKMEKVKEEPAQPVRERMKTKMKFKNGRPVGVKKSRKREVKEEDEDLKITLVDVDLKTTLDDLDIKMKTADEDDDSEGFFEM